MRRADLEAVTPTLSSKRQEEAAVEVVVVVQAQIERAGAVASQTFAVGGAFLDTARLESSEGEGGTKRWGH